MAIDSSTEAKLRASIRGVSEAWMTHRGLTFSRLPKWTYPQHAHAPIVAKMAERLSGARFEIQTKATEITLRYRSIRDSNPSSNWIANPSTISVTTGNFEQSISHENGDTRIYEFDEVVEVIEGQDSIVQFSLPATQHERLVQIWLPHNCPIEIVDLELDAPWSPSTNEQRNWVHYGSSISHCEDAGGPLGVWPVAASRELGLSVYNLGLGGCANLEQFSARTIRDLPADLISLKLGINVVNGATLTERTFGPAVHGFIDTIREGQPTTPILVISPICCPAHENNPGPSMQGPSGKVQGQEFGPHAWIGELTLVSIRETLREIVAERSKSDANIFYMDGLELFDETEALTMPDGLHPDAAGYRVIAKNFITRLPQEWLA